MLRESISYNRWVQPLQFIFILLSDVISNAPCGICITVWFCIISFFVYVYLVRFFMLPTAYLVIPPCTLLAHIHMSLVDPISVRSCAWIRRQTITLILVHTSLTCQYWRGMDTCYFGCWRSRRKNTSAGLCRNGWVVGYLWTYLSVSFWCDAFVYVQDTDQQSYNSYYWM